MKFNWKIFLLSSVYLFVLSWFYMNAKGMLLENKNVLWGVALFAVIASSVLGFYEGIIGQILRRDAIPVENLKNAKLNWNRYGMNFLIWGGIFGILNGYFLNHNQFDPYGFAFFFLTVGFLIAAIKYLKDKAIVDYLKEKM